MSKADISPTLIRSRRAVLAGVACAAALPIAATTAAVLTAAPAAVSADDPVFAAIETHRRAIANVRAGEADLPEEQFEEAVSAECRAADCLVEVAPTTLQGLLAVLVHLAETRINDPEVIGEQHMEPLIANLGRAAARFVNGGVGKAVMS